MFPKQRAHYKTSTMAILAGLVLLISLLALPVAHAYPQSTLTITGQDQNGNPVTGFSVSITDPTGAAVSATGSNTYSLNSNWLYLVQIQNTASCSFAYWSPENSASNPLYLSINGPLQLTAVFNCSGAPASLTVVSQATAGYEILGYYTVTYFSTGATMATGFTPSTYNVTPGSTYWVLADSFGFCGFVHWSDGITANPRPVAVSSQPMVLIAVYVCTPP